MTCEISRDGNPCQAPPRFRRLPCLFPRSFQDGNIFNYLVHRGHPQLVDISNLDKRDKLEKLETAFTAAEKFGVPKLLAAEDVAVHPDEQSVLTYLSVFRAKVEAEGNMPPVRFSNPFIGFFLFFIMECVCCCLKYFTRVSSWIVFFFVL